MKNLYLQKHESFVELDDPRLLSISVFVISGDPDGEICKTIYVITQRISPEVTEAPTTTPVNDTSTPVEGKEIGKASFTGNSGNIFKTTIFMTILMVFLM